jgi:hypothetical protein
MQWGQGIQLVEDYLDQPAAVACNGPGGNGNDVRHFTGGSSLVAGEGEGADVGAVGGEGESARTEGRHIHMAIQTVPFVVEAGELVELIVRSSADSSHLQFQLVTVTGR